MRHFQKLGFSEKSTIFVLSSRNLVKMITLWGDDEFHEDRTKIVDFSLMANFGVCPVIFASDFKYTYNWHSYPPFAKCYSEVLMLLVVLGLKWLNWPVFGCRGRYNPGLNPWNMEQLLPLIPIKLGVQAKKHTWYMYIPCFYEKSITCWVTMCSMETTDENWRHLWEISREMCLFWLVMGE